MESSLQTGSGSVAVVTDLDALASALAVKIGMTTGTSTVGQPEPYLCAEKAAEYIAGSKQRIYDLNSRGRLRCVKDGSRLLTKRSWLDAYLEGDG